MRQSAYEKKIIPFDFTLRKAGFAGPDQRISGFHG